MSLCLNLGKVQILALSLISYAILSYISYYSVFSFFFFNFFLYFLFNHIETDIQLGLLITCNTSRIKNHIKVL